MKKICLVILYFGNLPKYFQLWLETCRFNHTIDFLIFTNDRTKFNYPSNVKVEYTSFDEIRARFQKIMNFEIVLNSPYKLCDYKPAYGEAFEEYLKEYEFWGHCDIDLFFGNIRHFITDDILNNYDRILTRGHFSLYKNTNEINIMYRTVNDSRCQSYKNVYKTDKSCCFDEWGAHCGNGVSEIFKNIGVKQYDEIIYADLAFLKYQFKLAQNMNDGLSNRIFVFNEGNLYSYAVKDREVVKQEYMYCHFQKRDPKIKINNKFNKFCFLPPNEFKQYDGIEYSTQTLKKLTKVNKIYNTPIIFRKKQVQRIIKNCLQRHNNNSI